MTLHLGDVPAGTVLYVPFSSYDVNGASVTLTGLAVTDIEIFKDGSVTQRASDAGYTLLDTDGIDFDGITGIHGFSVDLADNTTAGFYAAGSFYWVIVSAVTISAQTVNFVAATFRIRAASIDDVADAVDALPSGAVLGARFDTVDAAGVTTQAAISSLGEDIDTAVADLPTNAELATALGTADDAVLAAIAALNNLSAAAVNAEVVDALATDAYAEPTGVPAATDDLATKIGWLFMALRNQVTATATKKTFYDDGGAAEWEKDLSDDGSTYTETEANAI